jgi:hypothetical protein
MQYAALACGRTACRTGDRRHLLEGEFALFHLDRMRLRWGMNLFTFGHCVPVVEKPPTSDNPITTPREVGNADSSVDLVVQDDTQQGIIDTDYAVVFDEAQLPEFVHEKIYSRSCRTNHFR